MEEIETILWDFLRGVRQGSFRDDAILVKACTKKVEIVVADVLSQSRTLQTTESIEEKDCLREKSNEGEIPEGEELTTRGDNGTLEAAPPPITPTQPLETDKERGTSDQRGERDTSGVSKSSIAEFGTIRKKKNPNSPSPPTRGEFFIWFPFEEFGDISVSDGILKFFLDASRPAGNPLACNLTVLQVAKWYVWKLSLGAFSRYTPRGHTRGVQAFWANLGKWNKSGLEELEEAAVWCRRVGTAGKVAHAKRDRELRENIERERKNYPRGGDSIEWEEF